MNLKKEGLSVIRGILVHGRHLQTEKWEELVWGEPPNRLGSLPTMILLALNEQLEGYIGPIVFGTGASQKICFRKSFKEAIYIKDFLIRNIGRLGDFTRIREHPLFKRPVIAELLSHIICETKSQNTYEEIVNTAKIFKRKECRYIFHISCGSHIARCIQSFLQAKEKGAIPPDQIWYAAADDTMFAGASASDTIIIEPPHRGDDPMTKAPIQAHQIIPRIFKLQPEERIHFLGELDALLASYGA